ncbi:hypothetical protein N657DRAFT_643105 [Parathielavia appendiculata]|uniref:Uncharacterized protein n=1 Tax=Parathielavia appendiculata TaxID=2587402 RepID=A0AAN6U4G7_9PEZI|nr:hypothetical protein N657DRAFT_643105 [Parathielavia appendiculata]
MAGTSVVGVMAGSAAPGLVAAANASLMASLTQEELGEMREYSKLLQFRDRIISGTHPRIKPSHLPGKAAQAQRPPSAPDSFTPAMPPPSQSAAAKGAVNSGRPVVDNFQSYQANQQRAQVTMPPTVPGLGTLSGASGKPEINPVLLEKSDDLIKAEIQLQRQRVERGLKEQLEQRRTANKASEQLAELDVADIMAKAMSLVHATPPVQPADDTAANASASNDSADDDTFYSSRHDTPESNMASRLPNESEEEEMKEGSPYEPVLDLEPVIPVQGQRAPLPAQQAEPNGSSSQPKQLLNLPVSVQVAPAAAISVPGLSLAASSSAGLYQPQLPEVSGAAQSSSGSLSEDLGKTKSAHDVARNERLLEQAQAREPPVVRGHNLSPLAPQPTHVVQPAVAREPQLGPSEPGGRPQAAPAQVTALRKRSSNGSSPESSPHGSKSEKKKNKKKKRKADRAAAETAASPYIKPEPRSPSPLTPQYARPHKRQRYSQQQPLEIHDDEPRYEQPRRVEEGYQERYQPRIVRQERVVGYERADDYRPRDGEEPILIASPKYERVYYDDYRPPPASGYPTGPESAQYVPREVRTVQPAPRLVEGPCEKVATYYRNAHGLSRVSVRPTTYAERSQSPVGYERPPAAAMPPPRAPPRRIIVDAFGREYLEPARPATVVREEVVTEPRGPYERLLPPRSISRRPEPLDDDVVFYTPSSPAYAAPRRVITQPEYFYREQPGPSNSIGTPSAEYLPSRPEPAREYIPRASSVRPARESAHYDAGLPSHERLPVPLDDRPPPPPREFYRAASARPTAAAPEGAPTFARYEVPIAYERRLGPDDPSPVYRSASVRPHAQGTSTAAARYEAHPPPPALREYEYAGPARRVEYVPGPAPGPAPDSSPAGYRPHHQYHQQQHKHQQESRDGRRETMPPPPAPLGRAYSVMPGSELGQAGRGPVIPEERYYGRALPPHQQRREDEEMMHLESEYI